MSPTLAARHDVRHRVLGYLVARGVTERAERERLLEQLLGKLEQEDPTLFGSPQATVRAIDALTEETFPDDAMSRQDRSWLPAERSQAMPRQPLGELPAVLRGSFWMGTARWAWPRSFKQSRGAVVTESSDAG